jgi:pimeloyl-ACP methyl ester carboxylesterase
MVFMDALVRDTRIAYDDTGSGPPVVRLHGLTGSRGADDATGAFGANALVRAGRRVVRYDARGHGSSGGEKNDADYAWPNLAHDLLALLDVLGVDRPVGGVGSSMGTATLLHAALLAPDRFDRLVLACPPTAWASRAAQSDVYRAAALFVERNGKDAFVRAMRAQPRPPVLAESPPGPVDIDEALLPSVLRGAAASDLPAPEQIAVIRTPTLVLAWDGDPGHPVSTAERLHELIPGSALHVARTPAELRTWGDRTVAFVSRLPAWRPG